MQGDAGKTDWLVVLMPHWQGQPAAQVEKLSPTSDRITLGAETERRSRRHRRPVPGGCGTGRPRDDVARRRSSAAVKCRHWTRPPFGQRQRALTAACGSETASLCFGVRPPNFGLGLCTTFPLHRNAVVFRRLQGPIEHNAMRQGKVVHSPISDFSSEPIAESLCSEGRVPRVRRMARLPQ